MGFYPISVERASARIAFRKKIKQKRKSKKEIPIRYIGPIIAAHIAMRKEKNLVCAQSFDASFSAFQIIPKNISYPHRRSDFLYALYHHVETFSWYFSCSRLHAKNKKFR